MFILIDRIFKQSCDFSLSQKTSEKSFFNSIKIINAHITFFFLPTRKQIRKEANVHTTSTTKNYVHSFLENEILSKSPKESLIYFKMTTFQFFLHISKRKNEKNVYTHQQRKSLFISVKWDFKASNTYIISQKTPKHQSLFQFKNIKFLLHILENTP